MAEGRQNPNFTSRIPRTKMVIPIKKTFKTDKPFA